MNTPLYHKTSENMPWPKDRFFYLLTADGLFLCRNHEFFQSCVPLKGGPKELAKQEKFVRISYPKLPQYLVERAVGFFRLIAERQNSEAAALWIWNKTTKQVELLVPDQKAVNSGMTKANPKGYPMDVHYETPALPAHLMVIGDIHSHVDGGAYASGTDTNDETHRPGIHIIVGHIYDKVPQFYCDAVVDGERFSVHDLNLVWEGFNQPDTLSIPTEWLERVKVEEKKWETTTCQGGGYSYRDTTGLGSYSPGYGSPIGGYDDDNIQPSDKKIMKGVLAMYLKRFDKPHMSEVRQELFMRTKHVPYLACERKAQKFIDNWDKMKGNHHASLGKE